jgi:hypothetical protein
MTNVHAAFDTTALTPSALLSPCEGGLSKTSSINQQRTVIPGKSATVVSRTNQSELCPLFAPSYVAFPAPGSCYTESAQMMHDDEYHQV